MSGIWTRMYSHGSMTSKAISLLPSYREFRKTYKFLKKSQWWSKEKLEEYQMMQLSKLLLHAYENVPYYTRVFDERGLKPSDIQGLNDLQKLPFLTKEIMRENSDDLKATNIPEDKLEYVTTGGFMSIPLGVYYERNVSRAKEWAFMKTQWDRVGYHFRYKCAYLRGIAIKSADKNKFWEYSLFRRWLVLSPFHMSDKNLPKYIEKIRRFKPKFIQAFPSEITILARYMKEHNIKPFPTIKALLCGSESLYPWQRELLEEVFQCRIYSWYGHTEQGALGGECEVSTDYHLFPEYGIVEFVDKFGKVINGDELGEIVTTGFSNYAMPLIRYKTMDLAKLSKRKCKCGRNYDIVKRVEGRVQELVITKDKRSITLLALLSIIREFDAFSRLKEIQFIQEKEGELRFKIVRGPQYLNKDKIEILTKLYRTVGDGLDVKIEYVDSIPRTSRGKHRFLVQKLKNELNGGSSYE